MTEGAGTRAISRFTPARLEFMDHSYARGVDRKGAKMTARDVGQAMQMMDTTVFRIPRVRVWTC